MNRYRLPAILLVLAMVLAACGRSDDDSTADTTTTTASGGGGATSASFGDLDDVCQDGNPSGSPAQGVTPTEIRVAVFSDPGFAGRPGLNQEFFDTADVFAAWCNERGGINGRKIVVDQRDAALTNTKARMTEACAEDFVMVGGGTVFDQDGVETRLQCLLPDISGYVVSSKAKGSDLVVQPVPNSLEAIQVGVYNYLDKKFPEATDRIGALTGDLPTTKEVSDQNVEAVEDMGWKVVYNDQYPAGGVPSWTPYAQQLKEKGVKGLLWTGEPENLANLVRAIRDIDYDLDFVATQANHYDQKVIDLAGSALGPVKVYVQSSFAPFEEADDSNATGQYLAAFEEYKPDGKNRTYLGLQAWSAWLLFAEAAKQCGNDLTRSCLVENAQKIKEWTGGGLHAPTNPGAGQPTECYTVELATPNGFEVVTDHNPNEGFFNCNPKNVYTLKGDYGKGVTLEDVGQSIANLK